MTAFRRYDHLERCAHPDVEAVIFGTVHVFPKIDGTNAVLWCDDEGVVQCGSRRRQLSEDADNAGFWAWVHSDNARAIAVRAFVQQFPHLIVYGEWLVPHSLKTYRDDAWRRFYVFDVWDTRAETYVSFETYGEPMAAMGIDVITPLAIIEDPSSEQLAGLRDGNTYLIQDDAGAGEGVVLKNYNWSDRFGRQPWAKMVRNEFKDANRAAFGAGKSQGQKTVEREIVDRYCTPAFIRKEWAKVCHAVADEFGEYDVRDADGEVPREFIEGNRHRIIPRFLGTLYLTLIEEETRAFVKRFKNPIVDFGKLQKLTINAAKREMAEYF